MWIASLAFLVVGYAYGQPAMQADESRAAAKTAQDAIPTFAQLVTRDNYRAMGFNSTEEVRSATLGDPLEEFLIQLDELRKYQRGQDPGLLLHSAGRVTFPVRVKDATRSSLTVERKGASWQAIGFGAPSYVRHLDGLRAQLAQREGQKVADYFEVKAPALRVSFVGVRKGGKLFLTPLLDDGRFGFKAGTPLPAEDALAAMVQAARDHNGLPS
jgi:hypothetical protein